MKPDRIFRKIIIIGDMLELEISMKNITPT